MPRRFRILGALGTGSFAPLVAEELWPGGSARVVLARPAPEAVSGLGLCGSDQVVAERGRVVLDGRELGIYPYAPGVDVHGLIEGRAGLGARAVDELRARTRAVLEVADKPHGALTAASIRVDRTGRVRLVGFRGVPADDRAELDTLLAELSAETEEETGLDALADRDESEWLPHAWAGRMISESSSTADVPPKVRAASIAALTMVLGFLAGWFLVPR